MSPIIFQTALYASLALCALGLAWRVSAWFRVRVGPDAREGRQGLGEIEQELMT